MDTKQMVVEFDHKDGEVRPLVSVVIPVFNRAQKIVPALDSVRQQSLEDFECLVVDDGSSDTDELEEIVHTNFDRRFVVLRKQNGGASSARNYGVDRARGKYIAFLDSDDRFLPDKIEKQLAAADLHGCEPFLCYTRIIVDRGVGRTWLKPPRAPQANERIDEYLMADAGWIQTSTMLLPAALARSVRFNEVLPSSQDTDFAIRCCNAGAAPLFVAEPLVVMDDKYDPARVSKQRNFRPLLAWIDSMRGTHISEKSYWAYRGWQCARIASYTSVLTALRLYCQSAIKGVYGFRVAVTVFAQIVLPQNVYQGIATTVVRALGKR